MRSKPTVLAWLKTIKAGDLVPRLATNPDWSKAAPTPEDMFVLSRVDGHSTLADLLLVTGLPRERSLEAVAHLCALGLVELPGAPEDAPAPVTPAAAARAARTPPPAARPAPTVTPEAMAAASLTSIPPFEADPTLDLPVDKQREVHEVFHHLQEIDFYTLLGLGAGSTTRDVQRGFRKTSMRYHPDRFFGKALGGYLGMLEAIFRHMTNVAEYLSDDAQRATYEASLNLPPDSAPPPASPTSAELPPVQPRRPVTPPPEAPPSTDTPPPARELSREERLRRVGGAFGMTGREVKAAAQERRTPTATAIPSPTDPERDAQLRRERQSRTLNSLTPQAERREKAKFHFDEGIKALLAGNFAAAASNLKLATTFDPMNEQYREKEHIASTRAREKAAEGYVKRGAFEESMGRLEEASQLYCMAAERSPTVTNLTKAAAVLRICKDLKRAVELASRAKKLDPNSIPALLTLAGAYLDAGMPKNARREVEYVMRIDPDNAAAKVLLRDIRKQE